MASQPPGAGAGRARIVVNPTAGRERAPERLVELNARLRERLPELDVVMTVGDGDAEAAAADAAERGYSHVFAAGGDGTLNEVINGVLRVPGALDGVVLGVLPLGTGNDFARALGVGPDLDEALRRLVDGQPREVDVGFLDDRAFLNSSAAGLVAETSVRVDSTMKTMAGALAYLAGGARTAMDYEAPTFEYHFSGFPQLAVPVQLMVVANGPTIGGGYPLCAEARIDDGQLDLLVIKESALVSLAGLLMRAARGETLEEDDSVVRARFSEMTFRASAPSTVNTDGAPRTVTGGRYTVRPHAARFLC